MEQMIGKVFGFTLVILFLLIIWMSNRTLSNKVWKKGEYEKGNKILKSVFALASREGFVVMPSTKLALFNPLISLISDESRKISMDLDYKIYSKK